MVHDRPTTQVGAPRTPFIVTSAGRTDVGTVREVNEDNYIIRANLCLWAVADGMGGHARGDYASQTVVDFLGHVRPWSHPRQLMHDVVARLEDANTNLQAAAAADGSAAIGSTAICLLALDTQGLVVWAGDSRAYRVRHGQIEQLSKDHSVVEDLVDAGVLAREDAEDHPHAHVLTRAIGATAALELDFETFQIAAGDTFILCSDGLTRMVTDAEIRDVMNAEPDLNAACDWLINLALERGASDNVTVVTVAFK